MTTPTTSEVFILQRIDFQNRAIKSADIWLTCLNCEYWQHNKELCMLFNARPPANIIVTGCKDHITDIPF